MKISGNTILITGGASGIGFALAEEFRSLGNIVLIAGRSKEKLTQAEKRGFRTFAVDMTDHVSIQELAKQAVEEFPNLNVVIQNAGVMKRENLVAENNTLIQNETIATNLLGPIRLTDALLPHFLKQTTATVVTVTSGLAFMPLSLYPTYCATKAAIHSYSESLRYQLRKTSVDVIEIAPPYVQTNLTGAHQAVDPNAMPLSDFISEVMQILKENPQTQEVLVKRVLALRNSGEGGREKQAAFFNQFNDAMILARGAQ